MIALMIRDFDEMKKRAAEEDLAAYAAGLLIILYTYVRATEELDEDENRIDIADLTAPVNPT